MLTAMVKVRAEPRDTFPLIMATIRTDPLLATVTTRLRNQGTVITGDSHVHPINPSLLLYINYHRAHQGI